jgi:DNA polymerase-1
VNQSEQTEYVYVDTDRAAQEAVDFLKQHDRLGYDVETTGLNIVGNQAKLLLMQLGTEEVSYIFDPYRIDPLILKEVLESPDILKIGHNLKFDYQMTRHETGMVLTNMFDTMLAYRLLTSGLIEDGQGGYLANGFRDKNKKRFPYKSLAFLTEKYLGIILDKSTRETFINHTYGDRFTPRQLSYAADDILVLHPLCDMLGDALAEEDLIDTALLEFEFIAPVSEMELNGVRLDVEHWRAVIEEARRTAAGFSKQATDILQPYEEQNTLFGATTVNINSQDQLIKAFAKLGFTLKNVDKKTLKDCPNDLAKIILNYRAYEKLTSTYGENVLKKIERETNRLHFTLHQLGADTGRLSSQAPNIQNMPNDKDDPNAEVKISFRECFVAEPGNKILTADYSQCELRILAEVSQDRRFMGVFKSGGDLHIITSQEVFGYADVELDAYKKVKKLDAPGVDLASLATAAEIEAYKLVSDFRTKTKAINFGIAYGLSAFSLAQSFKIPQQEAEEILANYFKAYSGIKRWLDRNGRETIANRYSRTLIGRKRYYRLADPEDEEEFRRSKGAVRRAGNNAVIQGTNADITKEALVQLQKVYRSIEGAKLLFTVHDEIVSECPEEKAEEVVVVKAEIMRQAFHRFVKTVPVGTDDKVGVTIADRWAK